ncbi:MAG: polyferredoxin-like protein [Halothiobacillaceae bacterium]|nr:MAG: polyferredoxin-like protein [Halothiobacillaceae bacterium]
MRANQALAKIPIVVAMQRARAKGLDWRLVFTRAAVILLLVLVPITGIFRIDLSAGFVVLGRQIWFSDFYIVFGLWLTIACCLVMLYSTLGTVFCGWACPQNTFSTWANNTTRKHLGKRAVIDWNGETTAQLATGRNTFENWLVLSAKFVLAAMFLALIPMLYFNPPGAMWSFVTLQHDERISGSLYWIYGVFTFIALVNIAVVRHFACRYMCVYRMWQFLFKTKDTLHVTYDDSRSSECEKCNFCVTTCSVDIDPRRTSTYDSCINCGECITACDSLHEKKGERGLLRFKFGPRKESAQCGGSGITTNLASALQRLTWVTPIFLFAAGLFIWGLSSYQPYHISVYKGDIPLTQPVQEYQISIANKLYDPAAIMLRVEGLPTDAYQLSTTQVNFSTAGRQDVMLRLYKDRLAPGLQPFLVHATAQNGWQDHFRLLHLSQ